MLQYFFSVCVLDILKCVYLALGLREVQWGGTQRSPPKRVPPEKERPRAPKSAQEPQRVIVFLQTDMVVKNGFLESLSFEGGGGKSTLSYETAIDAQYPYFF